MLSELPIDANREVKGRGKGLSSASFNSVAVTSLAESIDISIVEALVPLRSGGTKCPLFLFHDGTGHVLAYVDLASKLSGENPVYGIRASDTENDCSTRLPDVFAKFVEDIRRVLPHGPYLLGGQYSGGLLAFEACQQLRRSGEAVRLIILIDTPFPKGKSQRIFQRTSPARLWRRTTPLERRYQSYRATSYGGPVALVCVGSLKNQVGWMSVSRGSLKIVELPESDMGADPTAPRHVSELARTLDRLLAESSC